MASTTCDVVESPPRSGVCHWKDASTVSTPGRMHMEALFGLDSGYTMGDGDYLYHCTTGIGCLNAV